MNDLPMNIANSQEPLHPTEQHLDPTDREGAMAKADLYKLASYSYKLFKKIEDDEQLESWVQAKITKAADYIASVYHFLEYEMKFSEYGNKLENSDIYSESETRELKNKLMEAKSKIKELKQIQADKITKESLAGDVVKGAINVGKNAVRGFKGGNVRGVQDELGRFTKPTDIDRAAQKAGKYVSNNKGAIAADIGAAGAATIGLSQLGDEPTNATQEPAISQDPGYKVKPAANPQSTTAPVAAKPLPKSTVKKINKVATKPKTNQPDQEVINVQNELIAHGYKLKPTGILDKATQAAFKNYLYQPAGQTFEDLKPTKQAKDRLTMQVPTIGMEEGCDVDEGGKLFKGMHKSQKFSTNPSSKSKRRLSKMSKWEEAVETARKPKEEVQESVQLVPFNQLVESYTPVDTEVDVIAKLSGLGNR